MTAERQGGTTHPSSPSPDETWPGQPAAPTRRAAARADGTGSAGRHEQPGSARRRRWPVVVLAVALVVALLAAGYLLSLAQRWESRAIEIEETARGLGAELAQAQADLEESANTLALVESQLDGAQEQIHELADAVAQSGDDREVQRQVADYQAQVSSAATAVADAMDQCVDAQEELIVALDEAATALAEQAASPAPTEEPSPGATPEPQVTLDQERLEEYRGEVGRSCDAAREANESLQQRLEDS